MGNKVVAHERHGAKGGNDGRRGAEVREEVSAVPCDEDDEPAQPPLASEDGPTERRVRLSHKVPLAKEVLAEVEDGGEQERCDHPHQLRTAAHAFRAGREARLVAGRDRV